MKATEHVFYRNEKVSPTSLPINGKLSLYTITLNLAQ